MNARIMILVLLSSVASVARAVVDDTDTDAKAVNCLTCHGSQDINDPWTADPRAKRAAQAAALTGTGGGAEKQDQSDPTTSH